MASWLPVLASARREDVGRAVGTSVVGVAAVTTGAATGVSTGGATCVGTSRTSRLVAGESRVVDLPSR